MNNLVKHNPQLIHLLNENGIVWGFGGSCLLNALGVDIIPRDLDIVVKMDHVEKAKALLLENGAELLEEKMSNNVYLTRKFYTLLWQNVEIDFMADAGISKNGEIFRLDFESKGPWGSIMDNELQIFLSNPYDWKTYYSMMEGRERRVEELNQICILLETQPERFKQIKRAE